MGVNLSHFTQSSKSIRIAKNLGFVAIGGAIGGFNAGPPGNRKKGAVEGAVGATALGGAFLFAKKHKAVLGKLASEDAKIIFRRIRGRIVAFRPKL